VKFGPWFPELGVCALSLSKFSIVFDFDSTATVLRRLRDIGEDCKLTEALGVAKPLEPKEPVAYLLYIVGVFEILIKLSLGFILLVIYLVVSHCII
jgi:hypothetical protein